MQQLENDLDQVQESLLKANTQLEEKDKALSNVSAAAGHSSAPPHPTRCGPPQGCTGLRASEHDFLILRRASLCPSLHSVPMLFPLSLSAPVSIFIRHNFFTFYSSECSLFFLRISTICYLFQHCTQRPFVRAISFQWSLQLSDGPQFSALSSLVSSTIIRESSALRCRV